MLVSEGVLILESAVDKNIKLHLKGKSHFIVNDIDVSEYLLNSGLNLSTIDTSSGVIQLPQLLSQITRLNSIFRGSNGVLNRLELLENG